MPTLREFCLALIYASICFTSSAIAAPLVSPTNSNKPAQDALTALDFSNRTLKGVLWLYQQAGFNIIYSDQIVNSNMIVTTSPPNSLPIERLQLLLENFFLTLTKDEYSNTWYVGKSEHFGLPQKFIVYSAASQKPIPKAQAMWQGETLATSNSEGELSLAMTQMDMQVILVAAGFTPTSIQPSQSAQAQTVFLQPTQALQEEVLVTASQYRLGPSMQVSNRTIPGYVLDTLPLRGNDVTQVLNVLPGAASSGVSAVPNIRGGARDELLILFDDVELTNPFHLKDFYSLISALNTDVVEQVDIYTGGYPANYGSKMSGVMDIKPIRNYDGLNNLLEWNVYNTAIKLAGETSAQNLKGLISLRRGNIDDILDEVNEDIGSPRFSDGYATLNWQASDKAEWSASLLTLKDNIKLNNLDEFGAGEQAQSRYTSHYGWLKLNYQHHEDLSSHWLFSLTDILNERAGQTLNNNTPNGSQGELTDKRNFQIIHIGIKSNWDINEHHQLEYGLGYEEKTGDYKVLAQATLGDLATLLGNSQEIHQDVDKEIESYETHAYINYQYTPLKSLQFLAGMRFDRQNLTARDKYQYSPRLGALYFLNDRTTLKLSTGRYYQAPDIDELTITGNGNYYFDEPQKSDHYIAGLDYELSPQWQVSIESYRKSILAPKTRFENLFNPYSLLPDIAADRVEIKPSKAKASGIELKTRYTASSHLNAEISYSLSKVKDTDNQFDYYRQWNQRHTLQLSFNWLRDPWVVSGYIDWHSGWRTTRLPEQVASLDEPLAYTRNDDELPAFFTLNAKTSYTWYLHASELQLYLDITNLSNRQNTGYYDLHFSENETQQGYYITKTAEPLLPILPSLGIRWNF